MGTILSKRPQAPLLAPSMEGDIDEVRRLVGIRIADGGGGADLVDEADPSGNTAVHGAAFGGHLDVLAFLAEKCHADLTLQNGLGCSPLWIAAGYDQTGCLEYLIGRLSDGGKLETALRKGNTTGDSPFLAAASKGNLKACEILLSASEKCSENDEHRLEVKAGILRTANNAGDTPLKVAVATSQSEEMLTFLLQMDNEISSLKFGKSNSTGGTSEEEMELVSNPCVNRKNKSGLSPLIIACERNLPNIAELLLQHGADICIEDAKGRNPLAIAAFCGCNDTVEFLLSQISKTASLLNGRDGSGCTPLWLAARTGNLSVVKLLAEAGADAAIADDEGLLPKDVAAKFKKEKVEEFFSERET